MRHNSQNVGPNKPHTLHKYKMVKSNNTANLPLRSILKTGNSVSQKFPGSFPAAYSEDPDPALNLASGPTCSVSCRGSNVSSLPGSACSVSSSDSSVSSLPPGSACSLHSSQYGAHGSLAGHQGTRTQVYSRQVKFNNILEKFSPRGEVQYIKVSIYSPGTSYFREKASSRFKYKRTLRTPRRTSSTASPFVSSTTCCPGGSLGQASHSQGEHTASGPDPPAPSHSQGEQTTSGPGLTAPTSSSPTGPGDCPDPAAPTGKRYGSSVW